jgi:CheY-like chemotaxis protein
VNLARTLREVADVAGTSAPRNARIEVGAIPRHFEIDADPQHARQMFVGILTNALEALSPTGGIVRVTALEEAGNAVITFEDNGVGMDAPTLSKAFEPFFTTKGLGRGLGLSAALGIAQRLGGAIDITSTLGTGTTVVVRIPLAREARPSGGIVRPNREGDRPLAIVAESDPAVRDLVLAALQVRGFMVAEERSLQAALQREDRSAALIVASSGVSVIETLEQVRLARASGCITPLVLTTEHHDTMVLHPQDPSTVWLSRPFGVRAFLDAVDAARDISLPAGTPTTSAG